MVVLPSLLVSPFLRERARTTGLYRDSLQRNNMTELFEDNQRDLERAVENLSFLLEQPIDVSLMDKLRQDITNESVSLPFSRHRSGAS